MAAKDLYTLRTEAFTQALRSVKSFSEPSDLETYKQKLEVAADFKRQEDLDPDRLMQEIQLKGMLATAEHMRKTGQAAYEMRETSRAQLEQSEDFDPRQNMWIGARSDLQPGQSLGFFKMFKWFDAEDLLSTAKARIETIDVELSNLKAEEQQYGYDGDKNARRRALKEQVEDLKGDLLNNAWVRSKMAKKGDSKEKTMFQSYLNSIIAADTYLQETDELEGTKPERTYNY
jgi:hypothetical protein|tara:strand:- start:132 stop:824 length:693 start_codon:yes stop_codon:yes gene_type:complete